VKECLEICEKEVKKVRVKHGNMCGMENVHGMVNEEGEKETQEKMRENYRSPSCGSNEHCYIF
jgi:hypothetical protein